LKNLTYFPRDNPRFRSGNERSKRPGDERRWEGKEGEARGSFSVI